MPAFAAPRRLTVLVSIQIFAVSWLGSGPCPPHLRGPADAFLLWGGFFGWLPALPWPILRLYVALGCVGMRFARAGSLTGGLPRRAVLRVTSQARLVPRRSRTCICDTRRAGPLPSASPLGVPVASPEVRALHVAGRRERSCAPSPAATGRSRGARRLSRSPHVLPDASRRRSHRRAPQLSKLATS